MEAESERSPPSKGPSSGVSHIPRIIHQIFFRERDPSAALPTALAAQVSELRCANPGWQHRLYNLQAMRSYIGEHLNVAMLDRFDSIGRGYGAAKADLFRYLVLYREGGVYVDIKSSLSRQLDDLAGAFTYPLIQWPNRPGEPYEGWGLHESVNNVAGGEYVQCFIMSPAQHPYLEAVIERVSASLDSYAARRCGTGRDAVLAVTGPIAYTQAILPIIEQCDHQFRSFVDLGFVFTPSGSATPRHQLFQSDYTQNWRPLVRRQTLGGRIEWLRCLTAFVLRQVARLRNIPGRLRRSSPCRANFR